MIFHWKSGEQLHKPFWSTVVGLSKGGLRPTSIEFCRQDLEELCRSISTEKTIAYLKHLIGSLK